MQSVVSAVCVEGDITVERHVYKMVLTPENLRTFWERTRKFKTIFTEEVNGDFRRFVELFISQDEDSLRANGLFWVIDDFVGVYYMNHITEVEAEVHYTFFDQRAKGREELTREMLRYVFREYGFWRLNVEIPAYASNYTTRFVKAIGFKSEGRKRRAALYKGERFDVNLFGLLAEEIL